MIDYMLIKKNWKNMLHNVEARNCFTAKTLYALTKIKPGKTGILGQL